MTNIKRCGVIVMIKNGHSEEENKFKYLLVLGRQSKKWGFPKGHMEENESEERTALRELREETGIELEMSDISSHRRLRFKNNIYFLFPTSLDYIHQRIRSTIDMREIECMQWFTEAQMVSMDLKDCNYGLSMFIKKVLIHRHFQHLNIFPPSLTNQVDFKEKKENMYPVERRTNFLEKSSQKVSGGVEKCSQKVYGGGGVEKCSQKVSGGVEKCSQKVSCESVEKCSQKVSCESVEKCSQKVSGQGV